MDSLFGNPIFNGRSLGPRGRSRATRCQTAAEYTLRWGWTVALTDAGSGPGPGVDPGSGSVELPPGSGPTELRDAWLRRPGAELRLRTGLRFDALDVPETAGYQALVRLERMGVRPGPVLLTPNARALFLVAPQTAEALPDLLYRTGWDDAQLDLVCHGSGGSVPAPPTPQTRWLRRPSLDTAARPPEGRLLLGTLAYACHRGVAELVGRH
ncbi:MULTISPECIES: DNA primase [Streptacidiphilus]|uniref:DNA primase n=1 Tax=Streptacidiphilus cavernicola TaxID=3342716 RepID=A0ABV6UYZ1_9ACTN|nr:DNA primase [Streptacidiphilus jeojiense]